MNMRTVRATLGGVIFGALAGASVGFLIAPSSGAQTRKMVRENFDKRRRNLTATVSGAGSSVAGAIQGARQQVVGVVDNIVQQSSTRASKVSDIGKQTIEKEIDTVKQGLDEAKKAAFS